MLHFVRFLADAARFFWAPARAATFGLATTLGVMQQPTSHYYHATYGAEATVGTDTENLLCRAAYMERPEFRADGYADKDYGWFGLIGSQVIKHTSGGLYAFFGAGRVGGYTKATTPTNTVGAKMRSTYLQSGVTTAVAYARRFGVFELAAEHQVFVGFVDKSQVKGYVAWPFTFFQIRAGIAW